MKRVVSSLALPMLLTVAVLVASRAPAPFGYWCGLAAALLGPGLGVPRLLFPPATLSLPERIFIALLASMFITTAVLSGLNALGVVLTPLVIGTALLVPTYLTSLGGALRWRGQQPISSTTEQPHWLAFGGGMLLAAVMTFVAIQWLRI